MRDTFARTLYQVAKAKPNVFIVVADISPAGSMAPFQKEFPDRFMVGTDTYTPDRWSVVNDHAAWTRAWLVDLPDEVARKIAFENAKNLADWAPGFALGSSANPRPK